MAAVRIESEAFADQRYERLAAILGLADADHARGKMSRLWRQCTIERRYELDELDITLVLGPKGTDAIVGARLGERTPTGIRIKGTSGKVEWLEDFKATSSAGGKARASTADRGPDGKMLPKSSQPAGPAPKDEECILSQQTPAEASASSRSEPALSSAPAPAPAPAPAKEKQRQVVAPDGAPAALVPANQNPPEPESEHYGANRRAEVLAVFAHYRRHHPRAHPRPRSTGVEWRRIRARLDEGHTVADLCSAIDGYHRSPFHLGENDRGTKYLDLELIARSASNVLKGLEWSTSPPAPMTRKGLELKQAVQSFDPEMFVIRDEEGNRL